MLETVTAQTQVADIHVTIDQNKSDIEIYKTRLMILLNLNTPIIIKVGGLEERVYVINSDSTNFSQNPTLAWFKQQMVVADREKAVRKSNLMPDITLGYFNQSMNGSGQTIDGDRVTYSSSDRFTSFQIGLAIPIFSSKPQMSEVKAAELKRKATLAQFKASYNKIQGQLRGLVQEYKKNKSSLEYYRLNALPQADLILDQAQKGFENGQIGYIEYTQGLNHALNLKFNHLEMLNKYNQTIIQIEYILGIQQ